MTSYILNYFKKIQKLSSNLAEQNFQQILKFDCPFQSIASTLITLDFWTNHWTFRTFILCIFVVTFDQEFSLNTAKFHQLWTSRFTSSNCIQHNNLTCILHTWTHDQSHGIHNAHTRLTHSFWKYAYYSHKFKHT